VNIEYVPGWYKINWFKPPTGL